MKRGIALLFILVLSLSLISAGFFSDIWNKLTGRAVATCTDSDGGFDYEIRGDICEQTSSGGTCYADACKDETILKEFYCDSGSIKLQEHVCENGCSEGVCIGGSEEGGDEEKSGEEAEDKEEGEGVIEEGVIEGWVNKNKKDYYGYIIEFDEEPFIVKQKKLEEEARENEGEIGKILPKGVTPVTFSNLKSKLDSERENLENEREDIKEKIKRNLNKESIITGKVSDSNNKLIVLNEYENIFNGMALDITSEEAEKVRKINGVKSVYPNYFVNVTLMDSIPLINADDVWQLDEDGNSCESSKKECLTGKGVTIGIIDSGVDYTHEDLGNSADTADQIFEKINKGRESQNTDSVSIDGNYLYFISTNYKIYRYNFLDKTVSEVPTSYQGISIVYFSIAVKNGTIFALAQAASAGQPWKWALVELNAETGNARILLYHPIPFLQFNMLDSGDYAYISIGGWSEVTPGIRTLNSEIYLYDFSTKTLLNPINETNSSLGEGVLVNNKLYYTKFHPANPSLEVYDITLKEKVFQHVGNYYVLDSYKDEVLIFSHLHGYEIIKGTSMSPLPKPIYKGGLTSGVKSTSSSEYPTGLFYLHGDVLAKFNNNLIVYFNNKYTDIYDRVAEKFISLGNSSINRLFGQVTLKDNFICFYPEEQFYFYCISYFPGQDYSFPITFNSKVIGGYDFVNEDPNPMDDYGHGTHVAAIAAGNGILKGVAPDAKIYAYKVLDQWGGGYSDDILAAIEKAVDPNEDGNIEDHLDIISLSLGADCWECGPNDVMSSAIDNAVDAGVIAVVSAGNSGPYKSTITSPGTSRKAITVGASDKFDNIIDYSSRGPITWQDPNGNKQDLVKPDIVAPGGMICSAKIGSGLESISTCSNTDDKRILMSGTSMSAPHVSGAIALLLQKHPDWIPEEIKCALKQTSLDLGFDKNTQGAGRIDILKAINLENPNCNEDYCEEWSSKYCKNDSIYQKRTCHYFFACEGECLEKIYDEEKLVEKCSNECIQPIKIKENASCSVGCTGTDTSCGYNPEIKCENCLKTVILPECRYGSIYGYTHTCKEGKCKLRTFKEKINETCVYGCSEEGGAYCKTQEEATTEELRRAPRVEKRINKHEARVEKASERLENKGFEFKKSGEFCMRDVVCKSKNCARLKCR